MQRLIATFQAKSIGIPEGWLVSELEAFEFTYTATGVRYEAPKGYHDDGVMALGLAVHGWDRVQGVPPEALVVTPVRGDDSNVTEDGGPSPRFLLAGDFAAQLPQTGW